MHKKVAITIFVQYYPSGDNLLDIQDETGAINVELREAWQHLWDTLITRDQQNNTFVEAQALIHTEYDPNKQTNHQHIKNPLRRYVSSMTTKITCNWRRSYS